jgi:prepilin-type N-terminal cleavage/methylation domain-containing protein
MRKQLRNDHGVTLIELLVVVAIVAMLAAFFVPRYLGYRHRAAEARMIDFADTLRKAVASYEAKNGSYVGLPDGWFGGQAWWDQLRGALSPFIANLPDYPTLTDSIAQWVNGSPNSCWIMSYCIELYHAASNSQVLAGPEGMFLCNPPWQNCQRVK